MPETPTPGQVASAAYVALMNDAQRCACDTDVVTLCPRCACLLELASAVVTWVRPIMRDSRRVRHA